ncbi:hypothetical protein BS78_02G177400 [Paspalum vaginatum]|nr:hypothetical protein BS78_02G177400 [Paspalum vaginatum]
MGPRHLQRVCDRERSIQIQQTKTLSSCDILLPSCSIHLSRQSMARSPFVPMEAREHGGAGAGGGGAGKEHQEEQEQQRQEAVLLVHSQVRRIKREDEETRERLLKLRLLETRPAAASPWRAPRSLSPLRRAGSAIPVGE